MGKLGCTSLCPSLTKLCSFPCLPSSQKGQPRPTALSPTPLAKGTWLPALSYLGGVGIVLLSPAGFVAPGMGGVRVLGEGDAERVGVPKIRLLHAWAS